MTQARVASSVRRVLVGEHWLGVQETGQGQPVVLLHSGGFSSRQWRKLTETLAATHRVVVPDLLGYGASSGWPSGTPFHLDQDLAGLHALMESLSGSAHVVGHSYGGLLAMKLALATPDRVRSLALYEPVAFGILDEPTDEEARATIALVQHAYEAGPTGADEHWLRTFVDWWNGPGAWDNLGAEVKANFRSVGWKVYQEVLSISADRASRATYATITAPTLLLGGERTPKTEQRVLEKLAAALPRATLRMLPGMGHMGPITHAAVVNAAIAEHLRADGSSTSIS
jgi:pimeloyl-ACP methyl ester carboxylesterase